MIGLSADLDRYGEAIEHDLVVAGWTFEDVPGRLNWRALVAFVKGSAVRQGTALHRALTGDDGLWGLQEQLLAGVYDQLAVANWQRAASGSKRRPRKPQPLPRPGVRSRRDVERPDAVPIVQAEAMFRSRNPAAYN